MFIIQYFTFQLGLRIGDQTNPVQCSLLNIYYSVELWNSDARAPYTINPTCLVLIFIGSQFHFMMDHPDYGIKPND